MTEEVTARLSVEEGEQRGALFDEGIAQVARMMVDAHKRAAQLAIQFEEERSRQASQQLEDREWSVLLQFAQSARQKMWDRHEYQRSAQQAIRDLECEEREERRALLALYPAGLRELRVEFECGSFGATALDENRRRIAAMKAEEAGRCAIRQLWMAEFPMVVQRTFATHCQQLIATEAAVRERLLELWQSTWHQMRVAENLEHSKVRVTAMEYTSRPRGQVGFAMGEYSCAPIGRPLKLGNRPLQSHRPVGADRLLATEAWTSDAPRGLGVSRGPRMPSNALPELFAAAILKKEVDARLEVVRKEEQTRDSLLWSLRHGGSRTPPTDLFRVRGLTAPPSAFPMTPPALQSRPSSQMSVTSLSSTVGAIDFRSPALDNVHYAADGQRLTPLRPITKLSSSLGSAPRGSIPLSRPW
eukprot:GGOE01044513.1.p1 GENE.GGOE01044513.1~~GGOE01044513.1.p1  ORF type:complete len:423 (-),score=107.12 GGOE01044513.1:623-1867(-)